MYNYQLTYCNKMVTNNNGMNKQIIKVNSNNNENDKHQTKVEQYINTKHVFRYV